MRQSFPMHMQPRDQLTCHTYTYMKAQVFGLQLNIRKDRVMDCYLHPESEAVGTCTSCGKAICSECAVEVEGKLVCRECLAGGKLTARKSTDANSAFLLELIGGFFGLLGIGHMYVGQTNDGILRLVLWLAYTAIAWVIIALTSGIFIGLLCIPAQLLIQIGVPIWSAVALKKQLEESDTV